jgi:hypothetical protein
MDALRILGNNWYNNDDVYGTYFDNGYSVQPPLSQRRNCDQYLHVAAYAVQPRERMHLITNFPA